MAIVWQGAVDEARSDAVRALDRDRDELNPLLAYVGLSCQGDGLDLSTASSKLGMRTSSPAEDLSRREVRADHAMARQPEHRTRRNAKEAFSALVHEAEFPFGIGDPDGKPEPRDPTRDPGFVPRGAHRIKPSNPRRKEPCEAKIS
jgi:hypothetical protein